MHLRRWSWSCARDVIGRVGQLEDRDVGRTVYAGPSRLINDTASRIKAMDILERESIVLMPQ